MYLLLLLLLLFVPLLCLRVCLCEHFGSPGTGVTNHCEQLSGCWKLNLGALQGQQVLFVTEPCLQPLFLKIICKRARGGGGQLGREGFPVHERVCLRRLEVLAPLGVGVTGSCEPSDLGTRN